MTTIGARLGGARLGGARLGAAVVAVAALLAACSSAAGTGSALELGALKAGQSVSGEDLGATIRSAVVAANTGQYTRRLDAIESSGSFVVRSWDDFDYVQNAEDQQPLTSVVGGVVYVPSPAFGGAPNTWTPIEPNATGAEQAQWRSLVIDNFEPRAIVNQLKGVQATVTEVGADTVSVSADVQRGLAEVAGSASMSPQPAKLTLVLGRDGRPHTATWQSATGREVTTFSGWGSNVKVGPAAP